MGFLVTDITPLQGPTVNIPQAKDSYCKSFKIARTETASVKKAFLPADASITSVIFNGTTTSDAQTTATVTITVADNSGTVSEGSVNVKSVTTSGLVTMTALPNLQPVPLNGDLSVSAVYAETGTASATGGPWYFTVNYVR